MTYELIVTSSQGPDSRQVGIVTLNRPRPLNALNNELMDELGSAIKVIALVARDKRVMRLELTLPPAITTWRLAVRDAGRVNDWLDPQAS